MLNIKPKSSPRVKFNEKGHPLFNSNILRDRYYMDSYEFVKDTYDNGTLDIFLEIEEALFNTPALSKEFTNLMLGDIQCKFSWRTTMPHMIEALRDGVKEVYITAMNLIDKIRALPKLTSHPLYPIDDINMYMFVDGWKTMLKLYTGDITLIGIVTDANLGITNKEFTFLWKTIIYPNYVQDNKVGRNGLYNLSMYNIFYKYLMDTHGYDVRTEEEFLEHIYMPNGESCIQSTMLELLRQADNRPVLEWLLKKGKEKFNKIIPVHGPGGRIRYTTLGNRVDEVRDVDLVGGVTTSVETVFENVDRRLAAKRIADNKQLPIAKYDTDKYNATLDGMIIKQLTDTASLQLEGDEMQHCVGHYADACLSGKSIIYAVRSDDGERSTFEISNNTLIQHQGEHNTSPSVSHLTVVKHWCKVNKIGGRQQNNDNAVRQLLDQEEED